jgi:hypothetical protein
VVAAQNIFALSEDVAVLGYALQAQAVLKQVVRKRARQITGNSMDLVTAFQRG